ncbi:MAG: hypothetical protein AB7Q29_06275 [Vicinamibacterales bacterium]
MQVEARPDRDGVLYIATGEKYLRAAMRSAESVRRHSPGLAIHLYGDWARFGFDFSRSPHPFTSVGTVDGSHRRSKIDYLPRTPFARTLFLDTDTDVRADLRGMFQLLDRFDIAMTHAHRRKSERPWRIALPDAFPQFNSGVILFRSTPEVLGFLDEWRRQFHETGFRKDQRTLRELLYLSDLRIATLPPEYNIRFLKYHLLWYGGEASTKILHRAEYHKGRFWLLRKWMIRVDRRFRNAPRGRGATDASDPGRP